MLRGDRLSRPPVAPWRACETARVDVTGCYDVMHRRRDVRGEFTGGPVPSEVLGRILGAAHAAPSVGLSQPWDFVLVRDVRTRTAFRDHVQVEREIFASRLDEERAGTFSRIKVEGVLESSLGVVVTYDPQPMPVCTRCAWRSETCGWPRPPRARCRVGQLLPGAVPPGAARHPHPDPTGGLAMSGPGHHAADHA